MLTYGLDIFLFITERKTKQKKRAFYICYSSWLKLSQSLSEWISFWCAYVSPSVCESRVCFTLAWFESAQPTVSFFGPGNVPGLAYTETNCTVTSHETVYWLTPGMEAGESDMGVCTWRGLMGNGESEWRCLVLGAFRPFLSFLMLSFWFPLQLDIYHDSAFHMVETPALNLLLTLPFCPIFAFSAHCIIPSRGKGKTVNRGQSNLCHDLTTSSQIWMLELSTQFHTQTEYGQQDSVSLKVLVYFRCP